MKVSNLIQNIGKCRDIICSRDFKKVLQHLNLFRQVCDSAQIQVEKFIKSSTYEIDFTYQDLQELSDEIFKFIKGYQSKFVFEYGKKKLIKSHTIDNDVLAQFTKEQCDQMCVDARLREAYKILSYLALTVWLWTEAREQEELDWQVTQAIRSFL